MMAEQRPDRVLGPGHTEFWEWCNREELRLQCCNACGKLLWPVVNSCEHCGHGEFTWKPMSGRGKVISWCSFEHDYYKGVFALPHNTILVELDEGPLFISNPVDINYRDLTPDLPVTVAFIDCEDAAGHFKLPVFASA